jgi:hypothetical protein
VPLGRLEPGNGCHICHALVGCCVALCERYAAKIESRMGGGFRGFGTFNIRYPKIGKIRYTLLFLLVDVCVSEYICMLYRMWYKLIWRAASVLIRLPHHRRGRLRGTEHSKRGKTLVPSPCAEMSAYEAALCSADQVHCLWQSSLGSRNTLGISTRFVMGAQMNKLKEREEMGRSRKARGWMGRGLKV